MIEPAEILRTARKSLPGHWYKGDFSDSKGNYCSLGHIAVALGRMDGQFDDIYDTPLARNTAKILEDVIQEQYPGQFDIFSAVPDWNDSEERTEDEVIAIFEKAIAKAEEIV